MFKFLVVGEVILPQQLNNDFPVRVSSLSWQTGFSNRSEQNEYLLSSSLLTESLIAIVDGHRAVTHKLKCPCWNRITRALSDHAAAVFWQWKQYPQHYYLMAKLTARSLSTRGWLMALRETPSERRSSFSKQTCIPLPQTCLTSACSWHHTNTYLLAATMQSSTSV